MEEPLEKCEYMHVHEDIVHKVKQQMPDEEFYMIWLSCLHDFGDSTRIKILAYVPEIGECAFV